MPPSDDDNVVRVLRSSVAARRPASGERLPGELYVNFADQILGYIDANGDPVDLPVDGGTPGVTVHADLTGLDADDHPQYLTEARGDALFLTPAEGDALYLTQTEADGLYLTPAQGDATYLTPAQADATYLTEPQADNLYLALDGQGPPFTGQELTMSRDTFQRIAFRKTDGTLVADLRSEASDDFTIQSGADGLEPYRFSQDPMAESISIVRRIDGDNRYVQLSPPNNQTISTNLPAQNILQLEQLNPNPSVNLLNVKVNGNIVAKIDADPSTASADESLLTREAADERYTTPTYNDARYVARFAAEAQTILNSDPSIVLILNSDSGTAPANILSARRNNVQRAAIAADGALKVGGNAAEGLEFLSADGNNLSYIRIPGNAANNGMAIRDSTATWIALFEPQSTDANNARTVMTREKADARYQNASVARFKEDIAEAGPRKLSRVALNSIDPVQWTWGGSLPESDERRGQPGFGFLAEELINILPEAGVYQWVTGIDGVNTAERELIGLDPLTLIAALFQIVREQGETLATLVEDQA